MKVLTFTLILAHLAVVQGKFATYKINLTSTATEHEAVRICGMHNEFNNIKQRFTECEVIVTRMSPINDMDTVIDHWPAGAQLTSNMEVIPSMVGTATNCKQIEELLKAWRKAVDKMCHLLQIVALACEQNAASEMELIMDKRLGQGIQCHVDLTGKVVYFSVELIDLGNSAGKTSMSSIIPVILILLH